MVMVETITKTENNVDVAGLEMKLKDKAGQYQKMKDEIVAEEERSMKLQGQLEGAQTTLQTYESNLDKAKEEKSSGGFSSVQDVANIRKRIEETEAKCQDQRDLIDDLLQEAKRTTAKILGMQRSLNSKRILVFKLLAEQKANEIQAVAGELFKQYIVVGTIANNGNPPFGGGRIPEYLSFITWEGSSSTKTANQLLEDALKDGT